MISLHLTQLEKYFGTKLIFSDISFDHQGCSLGIAGANGSGKSTFLKALGYLLRPSAGQIKWKEKNKELAKEQVQKRLGYAAPYINLYDELSCIENLDFLARVRHENNHQIDEWIQKVELSHVASQPFGNLSTGQQQRLRLASALFHQPDILLLDEPGSNLDKSGRNLVTEIAKTFEADNKLLILASNDSTELDLCERVFSIEREAFV